MVPVRPARGECRLHGRLNHVLSIGACLPTPPLSSVLVHEPRDRALRLCPLGSNIVGAVAACTEEEAMTTHAASTRSASRPEVRTSAGTLRGRWEAGVAVFRGIPFAEPPVGALRFAAPRPVRGWGGVRDAVSLRTASAAGRGVRDGQAGAGGGRRRLADLNVWSPDPGPGAGLPVMVWIHGGAYTIGMSSLPEYDGGHLARDGGVVVVTFNYRVGIEGFAQIEGAPANRGLLDQIAALEWVRDDIRAFGGDPDRVTVFGESAGGGSVAALLAMPRAAGLFGRAVAQSAQGTFFSPELAADIAAACAAELGLRPTAADLSTVAPARLSAAGDALGARMAEWTPRWGPVAYRSIPFSPVVDGDALPVTPWEALANGAGRDIELLVGHTRDEHRLFSALDGLLGQVTEEQAETALAILAPGPDGARRYREGFPAAGRTSCTSWSTPTGRSACRLSTSPRPRRRPAAVPMSTS